MGYVAQLVFIYDAVNKYFTSSMRKFRRREDGIQPIRINFKSKLQLQVTYIYPFIINHIPWIGLRENCVATLSRTQQRDNADHNNDKCIPKRSKMFLNSLTCKLLQLLAIRPFSRIALPVMLQTN